jgi:alpha-galactosidase
MDKNRISSLLNQNIHQSPEEPVVHEHKFYHWMFLSIICLIPSSHSLAASEEEMAEVRHWIEPLVGIDQPEESMLVLANHDDVQINQRNGKPLKVFDAEYKRGLFCHAPSRIRVKLPGPGKTFSSVVGLDANGCEGSVVFSVLAGDEEVFGSDVLQSGVPGAPVQVDLNSVTEFSLTIDPTSDGISCDQANWADAKVTMIDGREIWLDELQLIDERRTKPVRLPFSFRYDGRPSHAINLEAWDIDRSSRKIDTNRTQSIVKYSDAKTGLEIRCVLVEYHNFPTVEWTVYFKNKGTVETPFIDDIRALDIRLNRETDPRGQFLLHHFRGSPANRSDYMPLETPLPILGWKRVSETSSGRSTDSDWPYFNLEWNRGKEGLIVVVGWPGRWSTEWRADEGTGLHVTAGQETTHLKLRPGEEIRTPLIVLQRWKSGDWIDAQNTWRRWMLEYNLPRPGGELPQPMFSGQVNIGEFCMYGSKEEDSRKFIDLYLERAQLDYYWMDTGWYVRDWEPDRTRFPNGIRPISDHAHAKGVKTILWFEPETIFHDGCYISRQPEWCLNSTKADQSLLDFGNLQALNWITDCIHNRLTEADVDVFRSDFNFSPVSNWRQNDSKDRQGATENHWVQGYLAFWDELLRRNPKLLIDSCASGGKRNDLETMRRSVPLWRSDRDRNSDGGLSMQCHTYGISFWLPYHGAGGGNIDQYVFRSCFYPAITGVYDVRKDDLDYELLNHLLNEWREINKYYYGNYYPLTPYSLYNDDWLAWQFDDPESGGGMVQVFRRPENEEADSARRFKLRGLDPKATYELTYFNAGDKRRVSGETLAEMGAPVTINERPGSEIISYTRE